MASKTAFGSPWHLEAIKAARKRSLRAQQCTKRAKHHTARPACGNQGHHFSFRKSSLEGELAVAQARALHQSSTRDTYPSARRTIPATVICGKDQDWPQWRDKAGHRKDHIFQSSPYQSSHSMPLASKDISNGRQAHTSGSRSIHPSLSSNLPFPPKCLGTDLLKEQPKWVPLQKD